MRYFALLLLLSACAAVEPLRPAPEGAQWISARAVSSPLARNRLDERVAAACPNGHEMLDQRLHMGFSLATASKLVRCH